MREINRLEGGVRDFDKTCTCTCWVRIPSKVYVYTCSSVFFLQFTGANPELNV